MSQCYYVTMSHSKYVTKVIEIYSPCSSLKLVQKSRHHSGVVLADNTVRLTQLTLVPDIAPHIIADLIVLILTLKKQTQIQN